ncbi:cytochrome c oxidase subunit 7A-related protein, mitochondrial-like [Anneissia japonica]|uniref:cytochrome c oxidase subunit 7A-related protein, mitochondrial-like n=1 Tax=Anneissia japonica TaxID=1529436 RepID=UPI0014257F1C|nr:cytochrome c oxidase subunit 7A-related protein, mitochondrial-like [Anneissia japonica]
MAFRYNTSTGKLSPSTPQLAYNPEGIKKLKCADPPKIQWAVKPMPPAPQYSPLGGDQIFGSLIRNRVYEKWPLFQANDGVPVHLKRGARDRVSFMLFAGFVGCSTLYTLFQLGRLINKK